jgi:hypothetical protein
MQRLATALVVCTLAGCSSDATTSPNGAGAPATSQPGNAQVSGGATTPAPGAQAAAAGAAAPSGAAPATNNPAPPAAAQTPPTAAGTTTTTTPPATGTANTPPTGVTPPAADPTATPGTPSTPEKKLAMDECGLETPYDGDEYCILPPPADKGFQLHIGPSNYENPSPEYLLQPGEENVVDMSGVSGNDKEIYYYYRQYRMRPGSHHVIITTNGRRLGGTQNLAKDNPDFGEIPAENEHIGLPLEAHAPLNANMHYYNFSDKPIIRELWVNFWYKDAAEVTEPAREVFSPTGVTAAVAGSHVVVGASCPVTGDGRLLSLYGHRHLNNVRFSVYRNRGGDRQLVLEDYESEHPSVFEFNSIAKNDPPNPMTKTPGAFSGMLDVQIGDSIDFECEIVNMTDKNFTGQNEAADDEMCILVGDSVGSVLQPFCTPTAAKRLN